MSFRFVPIQSDADADALAVGIEVNAVATSGRYIDIVTSRERDDVTIDDEVTLTALPIEMFVEGGVKMFFTVITGMEIGNTDLSARSIDIQPVKKNPLRTAVMVERHNWKKVKRAFYHTETYLARTNGGNGFNTKR